MVDDEENLRRHAARGAQAAVKAAKDRAQAFDDSRGGKEEALDRRSLVLRSEEANK
jgi:DNA helicase INO80